jgi:hypothetical protein
MPLRAGKARYVDTRMDMLHVTPLVEYHRRPLYSTHKVDVSVCSTQE